MEKKRSFQKKSEWVVIDHSQGLNQRGRQSNEVETNLVIWLDKLLPRRYLNKKIAARNLDLQKKMFPTTCQLF